MKIVFIDCNQIGHLTIFYSSFFPLVMSTHDNFEGHMLYTFKSKTHRKELQYIKGPTINNKNGHKDFEFVLQNKLSR